MNRRTLILFGLAALLGAGAFAAPAQAAQFSTHLDADAARDARRSERVLSYEQVRNIIRSRYPDCEFRGMSLRDGPSGPVYQVRIKWRGQLIDLWVDGRTGRIR